MPFCSACFYSCSKYVYRIPFCTTAAQRTAVVRAVLTFGGVYGRGVTKGKKIIR